MPEPLEAGDLVCVVDTAGVAIGSTTIARRMKSRLVTTCGRRWTLAGRWLPPRTMVFHRHRRLSIRRPQTPQETR